MNSTFTAFTFLMPSEFPSSLMPERTSIDCNMTGFTTFAHSWSRAWLGSMTHVVGRHQRCCSLAGEHKETTRSTEAGLFHTFWEVLINSGKRVSYHKLHLFAGQIWRAYKSNASFCFWCQWCNMVSFYIYRSLPKPFLHHFKRDISISMSIQLICERNGERWKGGMERQRETISCFLSWFWRDCE